MGGKSRVEQLDKRESSKLVSANGGITFQQTPNLNLNTELEGDLSGLDNSELIVVDPKRRRMGVEKKDKAVIQDQDTNMETHDIQDRESKNMSLAGAATLQAHHSS